MACRDRFVAFLVASALASSFSLAFAQSAGCENKLKDWGNRCEGTVDRPHAAPEYELLGFYAYRQDYPLRDDVNLRLRFYLPGDEKFFIEAREIKVDKQYEMQPKPKDVVRNPDGWREFTGWPVSAVLNPKKISADNLGVIVRLGGPGEDTQDLRPVLLLASQALPAGIEEYVLYLTVRRQLKSLDYQVNGASGYSKAYQHKADQKDRSIEGRTVIPIHFTAKFPPGPATLHISGPIANDLTAAPLDITYRFYNKPLQ